MKNYPNRRSSFSPRHQIIATEGHYQILTCFIKFLAFRKICLITLEMLNNLWWILCPCLVSVLTIFGCLKLLKDGKFTSSILTRRFVHMGFLVFNAVLVRSLSVVPWAGKSVFGKKGNSRALMLVCSQVSLINLLVASYCVLPYLFLRTEWFFFDCRDHC